MCAAFVAGCAVSPEQQAKNMRMQSEANNVPVCQSDADCKLMWDRATYYVSSNAQMAIRTSSENIIETYVSDNLRLHSKVNKVPLSQGKYRIESVWGCGNIFGCSTNPVYVKASFNNYVRNGF